MPLGPEHLAVALAAASIWSMGGVIFGIASLYPVLYYEGALESSSCGTPALDDTGAACAARMESQCCDAQQLKYTSITSVALPSTTSTLLFARGSRPRSAGTGSQPAASRFASPVPASGP